LSSKKNIKLNYDKKNKWTNDRKEGVDICQILDAVDVGTGATDKAFTINPI